MTFPLPWFTIAWERDELGPLYGLTFSREDGLQVHFGDRSLVITHN